MHRKKWKFTLLAVILMCLMVSGSFVGLLDSTYMLTSEKKQPLGLVEETTVLALDDLPLRMGSPMVYDSESDRVIFFGGSTENLEPDYTDTWSYDYNTNEWTNMSPAINPPASEFHQMAYHSALDKVVLFGGHVSGDAYDWINHNQTWAYDYNTNTWTDLDPAVAPPAMCAGTMVYDSESDLLVLFGGMPDDGVDIGFISETWTFDLFSNTWTNVTQSVQPVARVTGSMTYDSESDYIVLFGGWEIDEWTIYTDTWTFDANTNTWTEITTTGPEIVGDLVYDSEADRVVFYGGAEDMDEGLDYCRSEIWTYNTNTETWEMKDQETKPSPRTRGEIVYDIESDRTILLGGGVYFGHGDPEELYHDCWVYDLNSNLWNNVDWDWQEMTPLESPGLRTGSPLVYDIESDRMVVFSGWDSLGYDGSRYNDTFTYDYNTNTWTNMSPVVQPAGRGGHAMTYSQKDDTMIMFGGITGHQTDYDKFMADTWTYDLNTNTWTNMSPASNPTPRAFTSLAYDNKSDVFVLFGGWPGGWGNAHQDTWIYNLTSNTWTNVTTSIHPDGRLLSSMIYDYTNDRTLLFSGTDWDEFKSEIWEYNVTANLWTELIPTTSGPSFGSGSAFDIQSDLVISTGGPIDLDESIFVSQTWAFNITSEQWNNTYSPNNPPHRSRMYLAYDIESDRIIMYGGALPDGTEGEALGDTWAYDYRINPKISNPGEPRNLVVTTEDDGLMLTWDASIAILGVTVLGYNVYKGSESGERELIAELGNVLTYTDKEAGFGIPYYYAVTAYSEGGESLDSNEDEGSRPFDPFDDGIFSFVAYGDTRSSDETAVGALHDDIVSHYLQKDPELIIHTGDLVNHGGEAYQWPLFDASISAIADWNTSIEFFAAAGNHEIYTDVYGVNDEDYSTYLEYVDFSSVVDEPGETELYYSFDRGGIHFIVLNTVEEWDEDVFTCPEAQMDWLEGDLAREYNFTVVTFHNPAYSIRADRTDRWAQAASIRATFHTLFDENNVDIVFTGHDHYYYRTIRDGIYYVTVAAGGAPLYDIDTEAPDWQEGDVGLSEYHYAVASIVNYGVQVKVYLLDGTIADSFEITDVFPIPTTPPTNTTGTTGQPFPLLMTLGIIAGVGLVVIVLVLFIRKKN